MLKPRQRLDKYRIDRLVAKGGFATVYKAYDTVEGIEVALKIPHKHMMGEADLKDFRREVRLTVVLDHPNILPIKNATFIKDMFVIVYPLGAGNLGERLTRRISFEKAMGYAQQMLAALAFAHSRHIIHCDVKPENFILFPNERLRLADFGLAKICQRTLNASGSGTIGYVAPEQAMGRPSKRSDVFSVGLILYRMLSGTLPTWPFEWPPPGLSRLRRKAHPELIRFLRKAIERNERRRFADAVQMEQTFQRLGTRRRRPQRRRRAEPSWRERRIADFKRAYGARLGTNSACGKCGGPMSEMMDSCPWCGHSTKVYRGRTAFAARCRRCGHGMKKDWTYCSMCYGAAQGPRLSRSYPDRRYSTRCAACDGPLMPFMRYCPWCRAKTKRRWAIQGSRDKCVSCGWGVLPDFWTFCPWCRKRIAQ